MGPAFIFHRRCPVKRVVLFSLVLGLVSAVFAQEGGTPNSVWMYVGSTWYDYQGNGTLGRLIAVGSNDDLHFVWTNGLNYWSEQRQAYYNCWDESSGSLLSSSGAQIGMGSRSGYPTLALHSRGIALPVFNDTWMGETVVTASNDFFACTGAFTPFSMSPTEGTAIWPKIDTDPLSRMHMVMTTSDPVDAHVYTRAFVDTTQMGWSIEWDIPFTEIASDNIQSPTIDIACSRVSQRVATAWIETPQAEGERYNIFMRVSDDAGNNWNAPVPITNLQAVDTSCVTNGGEPTVCNGDTFSPYRDISIILDQDDNVHIAFSAFLNRYFEEGDSNIYAWERSTIWHWSEATEEISLIGHAWYTNDSLSWTYADMMCQKPSLAIDTLTGYLYCAYQQFDQFAYTDCGFGIAEYYLSVSTNNGHTWAVPTNVSNTPGGSMMPAGTTPSEQDIVLAKFVTDGWIHALYEHDTWAGASAQTECGNYLNSMVYMKTPVTDIPTTPLNPDWEFSATRSDVGEHRGDYPFEFTLHPNYPNPFNPATTLQFDLAKAGVVKLAVFDVLGKEVARLVDGRMSAGAHSVEFDGEKFASGVYFARLSVGSLAMARKMVLLK